MFLGIQNSFGQFKNNFDKELSTHKNQNFAKEQDIGQLLSWPKFKKGIIVTWNGKKEYTMLLGSATYLYFYLKNKYPDFEAEVIKPKSEWQIRFNFNGTSIYLFKKPQLKRQWQDHFAYQKPENYWVAYGFDQNDNRVIDAISVVLHYYDNSNIEWESNIEIKKMNEDEACVERFEKEKSKK